ncbi:alpha-2-HS-glycoprotein-like [Gymnodraco acuticeps]|uniref:Alpha-2-HS-glycoprotein-like n=1 Tax=Gymnodraco acuticeps TaxID=8218 RepID=A0A6P8WBF6_GYMAC|nr:alpha-2-HS-glycoprotein-like [Gymnodraco acuticeps]
MKGPPALAAAVCFTCPRTMKGPPALAAAVCFTCPRTMKGPPALAAAVCFTCPRTMKGPPALAAAVCFTCPRTMKGPPALAAAVCFTCPRTMKGLPALLLLLCCTALLCSAAPAVGPVTCREDGGAAAARMAAHHIDENHDHGYKFKLSEIKGSKVEQVHGGCKIQLQLDLMETTCHNINPMHFEDCVIRDVTDWEVMANCSVSMSVRSGDARVTNYHCDTRKVLTHREMAGICPDCSHLISLHDPDGMKSVKEAVQIVNGNTNNQNYFILKDVGRIVIGSILGSNLFYAAAIALVESHCPMGSSILPEVCRPLCPDRARHAFCHSTYLISKGLDSVQCDYYPPKNSTALGDGEQEPICSPGDAVRLPPPPAVCYCRRPQEERPLHSFHCQGSDAEIHPICPWPRPKEKCICYRL